MVNKLKDFCSSLVFKILSKYVSIHIHCIITLNTIILMVLKYVHCFYKVKSIKMNVCIFVFKHMHMYILEHTCIYVFFIQNYTTMII